MKLETGTETAPDTGAVAGATLVIKRVLGLIGGCSLFAMMALSVYDALGRSLFNAPVFGANDVTQVLLVSTVAVAVPLCILAGQAIRIDILADMLAPRMRTIVERILGSTGAVMLLYLAWRCLLNGMEASSFGETTMLLRISHAPFYVALASGLALGAITLLLPLLPKRPAK
ncbi:TRAP transporter small permease subunit [Mesorhizobium sp. NBSH29]|uniref:TRAP transporter small permease n=1 Tax=Mesorhizobium sp. NBSH29 TaxID=2654249 RepID=UPI0018964397|nr:TRAP transporter small permease [Mesorhizobium sp. NBSH29]QPC85356.1 TRAP transporter small permease subunit [Mesorhizobium sp. NBSH29]